MTNVDAENKRSELGGLGRLFLVCVLVHVGYSLAFGLLSSKGFEFPTTVMLIVSELTILVPSIIYILIRNFSFKEDLGFRPIKVGSFFMCILLAGLLTPLASFVNVVSQFFVSNTAIRMSDSLVEMPGPVLILLGGIYAPFCEEFLFRSIFFGRYEKIMGPLRAGLVSALLFAAMHLNINQAVYTFVLGVIFAIVNRAAGSVFPSMIMHMCINTGNLLMIVLSVSKQKMLGNTKDFFAQAEAIRKSDVIYIAAAFMLVLAIICSAIAIPVTVWISKHEGHFEDLHDMFTKKHPHARWLTVSMIAALIFVFFIMFGLGPLLSLFKGGA